MPTDLLSTAEAAALIGVDSSTLSRWVASERIAIAHKIPGKTGAFLFAQAEAERARDAYAAERAVPAAASSRGEQSGAGAGA